ncbi:hypothetical protein LTR08_001664 [Meristemomyces frigidus]|nr:hypothetical protein LTR08_001664 [Meristemomyces frigidus]
MNTNIQQIPPNDVLDAISVAVTESDHSTKTMNIIAERASVKVDIMTAIKPYRRASTKPPFSASELIVMAILCSSESSLSVSKTFEWAVRTFSYYAHAALDAYLAVEPDDENDDPAGPRCVIPELRYGLDEWEVPLVDVYASDIYTSNLVRNRENEDTITVPPSAGRVFLARWLEPARKGAFPFLKLPAELRNVIYQMVFQFPSSGLGFAEYGLPMLLQREADDSRVASAWSDSDSGDALDAPPMSKTLALLRANKQIYAEALPFFYRDNLFHFADLAAFVDFAQRLSSERLQHLGSLHVRIIRWSGHSFQPVGHYQSAMQAIGNVKELKKLTLEVEDEYWFNMNKHCRMELGRSSKFTKAEQIPGIKELAKLAAKAELLELTSCGSGVQVEALIRRMVQEIKAGGGKGKKRRRVGRSGAKSTEVVSDSEEGAEKPAKKVKTKRAVKVRSKD